MNTISKEVNELRARIGALHTERRQVWAQARSRNEVAAWVHNQTSRWAADAQEHARLVLRQLAAGHQSANPLDGDVVAGEVRLARVLTGLLGADAVSSVLLRDLNDVVPVGLDCDARSKRLFEIDDELNALEAREEALIEQSEADGSPVPRRANARPEIVLGERDPLPDPLPRSPYYTAQDAQPDRRAPRAIPSPYVGLRRE